eukprot:2737645-Prymnesium_polylepis.2
MWPHDGVPLELGSRKWTDEFADSGPSAEAKAKAAEVAVVHPIRRSNMLSAFAGAATALSANGHQPAGARRVPRSLRLRNAPSRRSRLRPLQACCSTLARRRCESGGCARR